MEHKPAACLFDLDGLLLDTEPLHGRGWSQAASHFGAVLSKAQLLQLRGRRRRDCAAMVDQWLPHSVGVDAVLSIQQPIVQALLPFAQAMPWAPQLVEHCASVGLPMALVTSSSEEAVHRKTQPHPWLNNIEERVYGDDPQLPAGKPDPAPFLLAAERLKVTAGQCWALEDSEAGTASALAAGCLVWKLCSDNPLDDPSSNPRKVIDLEIVLKELVSKDD